VTPPPGSLKPKPVTNHNDIGDVSTSSRPLLHADLVKIFPGLANVRITHSRCGVVAYTFDELLHTGRREDEYYATGCCGSGIGMGGTLRTGWRECCLRPREVLF